VGCPGQLTHTTTIPHGPLDILQAQEQVRHRGGDRRAHRGSNPGGGAEQVHDGPQQLDPQVLGTHESSNQDTQAEQSLLRPLSYKPCVFPVCFTQIFCSSTKLFIEVIFSKKKKCLSAYIKLSDDRQNEKNGQIFSNDHIYTIVF